MTERYDYGAVTPETVQREAREGLAEAERHVAAAVAAPEPRTFESTLVPLWEAGHVIGRADGRGAFIGSVHPDVRVREAAAEAEERTQKWRAGLPHREDLAAAILAYAAGPDAATLAGTRRRALDLWLRDVRRAGHDLNRDTRDRIVQLEGRAIELAVAFERNLGEWSDELVLAKSDLAGLADAFVDALPEGPEPGSRRLRVTLSVVWPFLEQSDRRDLREQALRRLLTRAVDENRPFLEELFDVRRRLAALLGRPSWSQFANEARMSGGADAVRAFLDRILEPLERAARAERDRMRDQLREAGVDDEVQAWDWPWLHERQRRALGIDSAALSAHLPLEAVLHGLFDIVGDTFGVAVTEVPESRVWHPDVRLFLLDDAASGERLASVYLDLFARDGKRPGAWIAPLAPARTERDRPRRPPALLLAANLAPTVPGAPVLLQHEDVATLFHEFGHVLEFGLSRAEGAPATDSWIELDFVEAPSQIMEHWAWSPEVLARFARHHESGRPPPDGLLQRLADSRRLNVATATLWMFGWRTLLDQRLHGPEPVDPGEAYREAFAVTGFPFVEGTYQPAGFAHTVSLYDAGFYSYLWAQAYGDDMFTAFRREGLLSPIVGRRYRTEVLEPSWSRSGVDRVRAFLGREPSERAFLERLGLGAGAS